MNLVLKDGKGFTRVLEWNRVLPPMMVRLPVPAKTMTAFKQSDTFAASIDGRWLLPPKDEIEFEMTHAFPSHDTAFYTER